MNATKGNAPADLNLTVSLDRQQPSPTIDFYKNAEAWKPSAETTLADLIDAIRSGEFSEQVAEIRSLVESGDKDGANALKKKLPAVSLSGTVTGRRARAVHDGRFTHSGLLQIDLDAKDNPGWSLAALRTVLVNDDRIVAVFTSPSGEGVKGVARIPSDTEQHLGSFLAAEAHFKSLNLTIDKACKDPVRLCFVSHDLTAWLRMNTSEMFVPANSAAETGGDACDDELDEGESAGLSHHIGRSGGIVIRGRQPCSVAEIRDMLRHIPYPGYDGWLKITNAVWREIGITEGTAVLQEWAPEKNPGDYEKHAKYPLQDVTIGTVIMLAQEHGWARSVVSTVVGKSPVNGKETPSKKSAIPANVFPVPAGEIGYELAARHIFGIIGPTRKLFMRGGAPHEVRDGGFEGMTTDRFSAWVETHGRRVARREEDNDGKVRWRSVTFPKTSAGPLLATDAARELLPSIRQICACPIITPNGVLTAGYHEHSGGTFIMSGKEVTPMPLDAAIVSLLELLTDFEFASPGDESRAIASLLSPALKAGGWIDDDFPLDVAEADQSQAGKSYRHKLIAAIYGEEPTAITPSRGGVGSVDEAIQRALLRGRLFINLGNFRGKLDSPVMEEALRGSRRIDCRTLRHAASVDTTPFLWQLSTNGAELTRDMANRAIITRIRKRQAGYVFRIFPEGDLHAHVIKNQRYYLAAVHAIVREWQRQGCQRTDESRHDFRGWCQALDWIVQNIVGVGPLLDGHREEQLRTANPSLQWLRDVMNAAIESDHNGHGMTASDIAELSDEHDLAIPGRRPGGSESPETRVGKVLGRLFREAGAEFILCDGRRFERKIFTEYDPGHRAHRERKVYLIATP